MKYTWGDQVTVMKDDKDESSRVYAVVVGLTPVDNEKLAERLNSPIGTAFYTVEYSDGSSELVSEDKLERFKSNKSI